MALDPRFPRNERELIRDFDLAGRLRDIRQAAQLRDWLAPKWWESLIGVVQFAAALGLVAAVVQHPLLREDARLRLIAFFFVLLVLALVFAFEFIIFRLHHLRRANEITLRRLEHLEQELSARAQEPTCPTGPPPPAHD